MNLVIPKSDLNIERAIMPQISAKDVPEFLKWLRSKYGVRSSNKQVPIRRVKPSQGEFNPEKIAGMMTKDLSADKPAVMSKDNYILDGHHRFAAELNKNPSGKFNVYWVDMLFGDLINAARLFDKSFTKKIHETINNDTDISAYHIAESILNETEIRRNERQTPKFQNVKVGSAEYFQLKEEINEMSEDELLELIDHPNPVISRMAKIRII